MTDHKNPAPAGYWRDAEGRLVAEELIKPIDKAREQLVGELIERARVLSADLQRFKAVAFGDIAAFIELSAEQYSAKIGGNKGNVTLTSFDGRYKIQRSIQDTLVFDERLQAAKQLIDQCVQTWGANGDPKIMTLVNDAFQVGKEGRINTGRVLGLRRLEITDPDWQNAMKAISDSARVAHSKPYIRFYERVGDTDEYQAISLDVASL
ncbi:DUF3164 family protein [Nevskia ramosa]|uniref:DUF3164 family protein n=1 Tax=Nevskia ramosa TaxID=64002 RepID=UPI002354A4D7|nr:DUF3164 family protein [Nevskia ramosa]